MPKVEASAHRKRNHHPSLPQPRFRTLRADRFTFEYDRFDASLRLSWSGGQQFMSSGDMRQLYGFIRRISEPAEQATTSPQLVRRAGLLHKPKLRKAEQSNDVQQPETTKEADL